MKNPQGGEELVRHAAEAGHLECLSFLLKEFDEIFKSAISENPNPELLFNFALDCAAQNGHTKCAVLLIEFNPALAESPSMEYVRANCHDECAVAMSKASNKARASQRAKKMDMIKK